MPKIICYRVKYPYNWSQRMMKMLSWMSNKNKREHNYWRNNYNLLILTSIIKWKRISIKMHQNNADIAINLELIVKIWNKLELLMNLWQGSWNVMLVERTGEIDHNTIIFKNWFQCIKILWKNCHCLNIRNF